MAAVDWSTLPLDLLGDIAMRLETIEDFIYFSAVCPSWNRVSSLIKHQWRPMPMPWLLLAENTSNNPHGVRKVFNPSNGKCYKLNFPVGRAKCWGSPYGWVAMAERNFDLRLFNPITKAEIHFPSLTTIPDRQLYDKEYDPDVENYINWFLRNYIEKLIVLKVSQNEFVIVVIYDNFEHVAFAKQGDKSWTSVFLKKGYGRRMFDVVAMNGYVFALFDASLVYWNIEDFQGPELVKPMEYLSSHDLDMVNYIRELGSVYLVESGCDLLMVFRYKERAGRSDGILNRDYETQTLDFWVYRLDPKGRRWEEIKDHATLFVGGNTPMSVSAKCLQPNYIYFTDDEFVMSDLGQDMGVYDMKCKKKGQFYEGDDICSDYCRPTWFIPQL